MGYTVESFKNTPYYVDDIFTFYCSRRPWVKNNKIPVVGAFFECQGYVSICLFGQDSTAVESTCTDNSAGNHYAIGSFEYYGSTWYYTDTNWAMPKSYGTDSSPRLIPRLKFNDNVPFIDCAKQFLDMLVATYPQNFITESNLSHYHSKLSEVIETKVDKVTGKELSSNDFTDDLCAKLTRISKTDTDFIDSLFETS